MLWFQLRITKQDFIYYTCQFFFYIFYFIIHYGSAILNYGRKEKVPEIEDSLLLKSATQLAQEIREGKLKSENVIKSYLKRIQEVEPFLNATVEQFADAALEAAREVDFLIASRKHSSEELAKEKPLLGVPFTVKVLIRVKGHRHTCASRLFENVIATEDAPTVALMVEAGAIIIATTNAAELAVNIETVNVLHGITRNPYDTRRTSGGSSGGEGALISAGGSLLGLGNDLLGSLRIPAHYTGIFAHKPSRGLVSNLGSVPPDRIDPSKPSPYQDTYKYLCTGPMCRYAEDLIVSMRILTTENSLRQKFGEKVCFKKVKIFYLREIRAPLILPVEKEIAVGLQNAISYFERQHNISAEELKVPLPLDVFQFGISLLAHAIPGIKDCLSGGQGINFNITFDLLKSFFGTSTLSFMTLFILHFFHSPFVYRKDKIQEYQRKREELENQLNRDLDEDSVLLMPTFPTTAHYHNAAISVFGCGPFTAIFNFFGLPSTHCPMGFNKQGMPYGIQIISRRNNDALTIACAVELEKAFGGWKAP